MNGKSFSFKSKTLTGNSARINVLVDNDLQVITIQKIITATENQSNMEVVRKFKNFMVLVEEFVLKESSMFNICKGLYDVNTLKHL